MRLLVFMSRSSARELDTLDSITVINTIRLMRLAKPALFAATALVTLLATAGVARAASSESKESHVTAVGLHNTYEKAAYPHLADALDSGTGLIEIDIWVFGAGVKWRVSHDLPLTTMSNNCTWGGMRTDDPDQGFDTCLDNMKQWHDANPGHRPITVKIEMKNGFNVQAGASAADFDNLIRSKLGDAVFTPGQLLGDYGTLDEAAKADNWPTRAQLDGKFIFEIIPGTFERQNPLDHLKTDVEYGRWVRDNPHTAEAFPSVLDAAAGDPRTRFSETTIRPWFVFFDGSASAYVGGGIDPKWYDDNHYFLVMTDAHLVAPALDDRSPDPAAATQRVLDMAKAHASIVSTDWYDLDSVLSNEVDRG
jgi:Phosphoinositide phospholipase C, Ca2+-dependent